MEQEQGLSPEMALRLIKTGKLSNESLVKIGFLGVKLELNNMNEIWDAIGERLNFDQVSKPEVVEFGKKAMVPQVWKAIVESGLFSAEELTTIGISVGRDTAWLEIIKFPELSADQLVQAGRSLNHKNLWLEIAKSPKLSDNQLIEVGILAGSVDVWQVVTENLEKSPSGDVTPQGD